MISESEYSNILAQERDVALADWRRAVKDRDAAEEVISDMLAALKAAVWLSDDALPNFNGRTPECQAVYDMCAAAIAKAEARP